MHLGSRSRHTTTWTKRTRRCIRAAALWSLALLPMLSGCQGQSGPLEPTFERTATESPELQRTDTSPEPPNPSTHTPSPTVTTTPTETSQPYFEGPIVIGYSVLGRPLEVHRFGTGSSKRMIIGGIHGGYEWNTILLTDQLIHVLMGRPDLIPEDVTLFVLRSMNPDGEARGKSANARANENRVDLNRNFPALWRKDSPRQGCWTLIELSPGATPASEPETLAVMAFLLDAEIEAVISYHSAGLGIFPGGQPPDTASVSLAEAVAEVSDYPYPPVDTGCQYTGQLIDWASEKGIAALDIELTNHQDTDLRQNLRILEVFLGWTTDD
jgi:predicted deacylase